MVAPLIHRFGRVDYIPAWRAMQDFTAERSAETQDQIWLLEHPPVFTLGQAGKPEHLLRSSAIPLVRIDRGGQITYHGPGQVVAYLLVDLKRRGYGVRELVSRMEQAVVDLLAEHGVSAGRKTDAPGVYVNGAKIAALGLRIKHGCSYHGLALNADMDLSPFGHINPCGYRDMAVTQARDVGIAATPVELAEKLAAHLARHITL